VYSEMTGGVEGEGATDDRAGRDLLQEVIARPFVGAGIGSDDQGLPSVSREVLHEP
jgi:hypothetical protein